MIISKLTYFFTRHSTRLALLLLLLMQPLAHCLAQAAVAATEPEMADGLRQSGKIYVVVASVVVIVGGLLTYLVSLDRKVSKLEKQAGNLPVD